MKALRMQRIFFWASALCPLLTTLLFFPSLPNQVAVHFGQFGTADRWGSKLELLIPGSASLLLGLAIELLITHKQEESKHARIVGGLLFLPITIAQLIICASNSNTTSGALEAPGLSSYCLLPAFCWIILGLLMLFTRTIRYFNLNTPWILLDRQKDRRAALFGGIMMLFLGCLGLAIIVFTRGSSVGFIASSLLGGIGMLTLYFYCRSLRNF